MTKDKVDINISNTDLIVSYDADDNFDVTILTEWPKAVTIPYKVAKHLNKNFKFLINNKEIGIHKLIN